MASLALTKLSFIIYHPRVHLDLWYAYHIIQMSFISHGLFCAKSENKKRCNLSQMIRVHSQIRIKLGVVKIIMMSLLNAMLYDHDHRDHACNQDDRHQTLGKK